MYVDKNFIKLINYYSIYNHLTGKNIYKEWKVKITKITYINLWVMDILTYLKV